LAETAVFVVKNIKGPPGETYYHAYFTGKKVHFVRIYTREPGRPLSATKMREIEKELERLQPEEMVQRQMGSFTITSGDFDHVRFETSFQYFNNVIFLLTPNSKIARIHKTDNQASFTLPLGHHEVFKERFKEAFPDKILQ
jgi:hypothetical protein